jgi:hypothetical protein
MLTLFGGTSGSVFAECGVLLLPLAAIVDGWCEWESHVTRLQVTLWRAQFEHGFSSSHCMVLVDYRMYIG